MAVQDLGNLADYIVNGDNYERVQPDGSTLVIPGQRGRPPLSPTSTKDTYRPLTGDCASGTCALIVHDVFTGLYYIEGIASFDPQVETCLCALANSFESPNCAAAVQAQVDALTGKPLFETVPFWLIDELGVPLDALFAPDFWFVSCYGAELVIPNLLTGPPPVTCPKGWLLVNGVCIDPPLPQIVPRAFRGMTAATAREGSDSTASTHAPPSIGPPLPLTKAGPIHPTDCGCDEDRATEDEIGYELVEA